MAWFPPFLPLPVSAVLPLSVLCCDISVFSILCYCSDDVFLFILLLSYAIMCYVVFVFNVPHWGHQGHSVLFEGGSVRVASPLHFSI